MVRLLQALSKWIDFPLNHPVISIVVRTHIFNNVICFLKFFFSFTCDVILKMPWASGGQTQKPRLTLNPLLFPTRDTEFLLFPMPSETVVVIPLLDTFYLLPVGLPCFACLVPGTKPRALDRRGKRSTTEQRT